MSLAEDIHPGGANSSSDPGHFEIYDDKLYFQADDGVHGLELYCLDGSSGVATLAADIYPGTSTDSSDPRELTAYGGKLFFSAKDGLRGTELWSYASTPSPITTLIADIRPGTEYDSSSPKGLMVYNDVLYFRAWDLTRGRELWSHDSSSGITTLVYDINPSGNSVPNSLAVMGSALYFGAIGEYFGQELWSLNSNTGITTMVANINSIADSGAGGCCFQDSEPASLAAYGGILYLEATDDGDVYDNYELWASDGTADGTTLVSDIALSGSSFPTGMTEYGGRLFFSADDGVLGEELWAYDNSAGAATLVSDINQSALDADSSPRFFTTFFY